MTQQEDVEPSNPSSTPDRRLDPEKLNVEKQDDGLLIKGELFDDDEHWIAQPIDDRRVLLVASDDAESLPEIRNGFAACDVEVFKDFLLGLHKANWSGVVAADTGYGVKKIFFSNGSIVFAGSNVIDDRLGEVIYREERISIDELTDSAAQVTKDRKFGQVLVASGNSTNIDLWDLLKLQVEQIVRSVFMVDRVFYHIDPGNSLAPTEVRFGGSTSEFIAESFAYGSAFRDFLGRLRAESEVVLLDETESNLEAISSGSFLGDIVQMIREEPNVQKLLDKSKMMDVNTVATIANLVRAGYCAVSPAVGSQPDLSAEMTPLKAKLDAFAFVVRAVKKAFDATEADFPITDLRGFAKSLCPRNFLSFYFTSAGELAPSSISEIYAQCMGNPCRISYFVDRLESLIQFLLQVAGDNLESADAQRIRRDYRAIAE